MSAAVDTPGPTRRHPLAWWVAPSCVAIGLPLGLVIWWARHGVAPNLLSVVAASLIALAQGALFAWLAGLVPWLTTGARGVTALDTWGRPREIAWEDVCRVGFFHSWPWPCLRIRSRHGGASIWAPLFVADPALLLIEVERHAGPEHPLRAALAGRIAG